MKNVPHLYLAEIPLVASRDVESLCRLPIANSQVVMMWDSLVVGKKVDLEGTRICPKCINAFADAPKSDEPIYLFGVIPGVRRAL